MQSKSSEASGVSAEISNEARSLFGVQSDICAIRDQRDLLNVVSEKLRPIFGFSDAVLVFYDDDLKYTRHVYAAAESDHGQNQNYRQIMADKIAVADDSPYAEFTMLTAPRVYSHTELIEKYPFHPGVKLTRDFGLVESLFMPLRYGGKLLGIFEFHAKQENTFRSPLMPLYAHFANQIAVAVSNILANEEILEREREKSRLLEITELIAQIKANDDLLRLIVDKIRPLFGFEDCGLFVVSADKKTHTDLTAVIPGVSPSEFNQRIAALPANIPHPGSAIEEMMRQIETAGKPVLFDFVDLVEQFPDYPQLDGTGILELSYRDCLAANLVVRGEPIGMFCINALAKDFFQPQIVPLFQAVAHSISIAVSNILANDEILERTREKSVLLAITEQVALIRDKNDLFRVIAKELRPIFGFDETATVLYDKDFEFTQNVKGINLTIREDDALYNQMLSEKTSLKDSPYSRLRRLKTPRINRVAVVAESYPDFIGIKIAQNYGFREFVTMPLIYAEKLLGVFEMYSLAEGKFQPSQIPLYAHLADQIAVALANILAGEEIEKQLVEIKQLKKRLEAENIYLSEEVRKNYNFEEIIGNSPNLHHVFEVIEQVAPTSATVLIQGETGTGKELIARAIHNRSTRSARPLIKINCATLPKELIESELFGHERGSFTGATEKRVGKFELADKGTIFLDEIGELPPEMQIKLLRVLQEREIERVGGKDTIKLDLRVVAATNRNLAQEVQAGRFRADLYYRLCTVEVFMPPLRERREDIEPLTMYFAKKYAAKFSRRIERVSTKMLAELHAYDFPGNIRELEHIVEHAVIFSRDEKLILPRSLSGNGETIRLSTNAEPTKTAPKSEKQTLETVEREHISEILRRTKGRIKGAGGAAEILGLNPATVYFRLKKLGIDHTSHRKSETE